MRFPSRKSYNQLKRSERHPQYFHFCANVGIDRLQAVAFEPQLFVLGAQCVVSAEQLRVFRIVL